MAEDGGPDRVEVALFDLNEMLTGIVTGILEGEPDVHVVALLRSRGSLLAVAAGARFDVAIVGGEHPAVDGALRELLFDRPRLRALAIGGDGAETALYELRPNRTPLGELSAARLLEAIRRGRAEVGT